MKWIKRNTDVTDFISYTLAKTGRIPSDIIADRDAAKFYASKGLDEIASRLLLAKRNEKTVCGVFDYDADGLMSAAEAHLLLAKLGIRHTLTVPRRFTDGYGVNTSIISRLPEGEILLTVDNGIAAKDAIAFAKSRGMEVLVMDHHNAPLKDGVCIAPGEALNPEHLDLPPADVIVDPEAPLHDGWDFVHYCGAGLVFKLACLMCPSDTEFLDYIAPLAAIATVADSVDVTGENARIIARGLDCINRDVGPEGLLAILDHLKDTKLKDAPFTAETLGYYLAPMINAPGRLADEGGEFVLKCIFSKGQKAKDNALTLANLNDERKSIVEECMERGGEFGDRVTFLYDERIPEGVCGIIAGRLCEKYHRPAFVMTKASDDLIKGSARSEEGESVLPLLRAAAPYLEGFGGHDQAAGFSLRPKNAVSFSMTLEDTAPDRPEDVCEYYDFELMPADVLLLYMEQNHIGIFGTGLEQPVVKIRGMVTRAKAIGADKNHLSFQMANTSCIAFGMADKLAELEKPRVCTVYGTIGQNWYRGECRPQIQVLDIEL